MKCPRCGIEIKDHPANACLDALFAELVMEWEEEFEAWFPKNSSEDDEAIYMKSEFTPSCNIAHAMEGVDHIMEDKLILFTLRNSAWIVGWFCCIGTNEPIRALTRELAICRALILWAMERKDGH